MCVCVCVCAYAYIKIYLHVSVILSQEKSTFNVSRGLTPSTRCTGGVPPTGVAAANEECGLTLNPRSSRRGYT